EYIETLWYLLRQLYDRGLLYKGYTIQPYSPSDGTGLSSHELNQPGCYKEVKDTSVVAQFKVTRNTKSEKLFDGNENVYILAWTTTPWTLPANSALTVGKNIEYVKIKTYNPYTFQPVSVILAKVLAGKYFSEKARDLSLSDYKPGDKLIPWKITAEYKGGDLEGVEYEQLLPYVQPPSPAFRVILGDFVTTEDGTGVVHTSPTFGADDFRVAQQNNIPSILVKDENGKEVPVVDKRGKFVAEIGARLVEGVANYHIKTHRLLGADDFYVKNYTDEDESNPDYKNTDVIISIILKEENKAFKVEKYEHTYPHSWRTDKPVLYYPLDAWFIRTTAAKDKLVELNQTINWKPESTGTGRFGNWLENLVDWNLSRSRFWGTPLPIWRTDDGVEELCIGSLAELKEKLLEAVAHGKGILTAEQIDNNNRMIGNISDGKADLHRPYVDDIVLLSPDKRPMLREPDLIDVWFDSGAMPYAQWHWPFEGQETFAKSFPADFISEGVDQTRGWFFTLHAIAGMLFDDVAFKNVVSTGLVLDKNGEKMSKRKGNVINPFDTLSKYGPDATRWYMVVNAPPWDNLRFNLDGITEVQRKFFGTLFNTYQFYALYANLDSFRVEAGDAVPVAKRPEMDRWIISVLQTLIGEVQTHYEDYEPTRATRAIQYFVTEQLSNWYVRLSRRRFWKGDLTEDKKAAYATLHECLLAVAQLMSPVAPFFGEWLYKNLADNPGGTASVHLTDWQPARPALIDKDLEERMALAQGYASLVHSLRKKHNIRVRQPLSRILIPVLNETEKRKIEKVEALILSEVNIKQVEYIDDTSGLLVKKIKPNFKKLGKQFGPRMKDVAALITALDQDGIRTLEKNGFLQTRLGEEPLTITVEDVEISSEDIPGWIVAAENGLTVALDTTITEDLRKEGIARDV
ncbi:MAG TPA: isoleucine--tRNA ligase, partial [Cytophagales bacterium]